VDSWALALDVAAPCGNGVKDGREQCDDGNAANGDGCSSQCVVEAQQAPP